MIERMQKMMTTNSLSRDTRKVSSCLFRHRRNEMSLKAQNEPLSFCRAGLRVTLAIMLSTGPLLFDTHSCYGTHNALSADRAQDCPFAARDLDNAINDNSCFCHSRFRLVENDVFSHQMLATLLQTMPLSYLKFEDGVTLFVNDQVIRKEHLLDGTVSLRYGTIKSIHPSPEMLTNQNITSVLYRIVLEENDGSSMVIDAISNERCLSDLIIVSSGERDPIDIAHQAYNEQCVMNALTDFWHPNPKIRRAVRASLLASNLSTAQILLTVLRTSSPEMRLKAACMYAELANAYYEKQALSYHLYNSNRSDLSVYLTIAQRILTHHPLRNNPDVLDNSVNRCLIDYLIQANSVLSCYGLYQDTAIYDDHLYRSLLEKLRKEIVKAHTRKMLHRVPPRLPILS
jgi:hypothetical protein